MCCCHSQIFEVYHIFKDCVRCLYLVSHLVWLELNATFFQNRHRLQMLLHMTHTNMTVLWDIHLFFYSKTECEFQLIMLLESSQEVVPHLMSDDLQKYKFHTLIMLCICCDCFRRTLDSKCKRSSSQSCLTRWVQFGEYKLQCAHTAISHKIQPFLWLEFSYSRSMILNFSSSWTSK